MTTRKTIFIFYLSITCFIQGMFIVKFLPYIKKQNFIYMVQFDRILVIFNSNETSLLCNSCLILLNRETPQWSPVYETNKIILCSVSLVKTPYSVQTTQQYFFGKTTKQILRVIRIKGDLNWISLALKIEESRVIRARERHPSHPGYFTKFIWITSGVDRASFPFILD